MRLSKLMVLSKQRSPTYVVLGQHKARIGTVNCPYSSGQNCPKYNNKNRIWTVNCPYSLVFEGPSSGQNSAFTASELTIHAIYLTMLKCKTFCYSSCFKNVLITHAISIFLQLAAQLDGIGLEYGQVAVSVLLVGSSSEQGQTTLCIFWD